MKVADIAKEFKISEEMVLEKLRSLRLKAKGVDQELNKAVAIVLRSELNKDMQDPKKRKTLLDSIRKEEPQRASEEPTTVEGPPAVTEPESGSSSAEPAESLVSDEKTDAPVPPSDETVSAPKEPTASATDVKDKKTPAASSRPARSKILEDQPFIPLKPLSKKRRRPPVGRAREEVKKSAVTERPTSPVPPPAGESVAEEGPEGLPVLELKMPLTPKDLAVRLQVKTNQVLKTLMDQGVLCTINQYLDEEVVRRAARAFGYNVTAVKSLEDQLVDRHAQKEDAPEDLAPRAPVVTFMGHVDHGKTSLLDRIRKSRVVETEHGGITQHMGAYAVTLPKGRITFLDTPGHEAFTAMRARGAHITDLVVLVIAADEGIMPQTEEAINHARAAGAPIIVALNKMDRKNADPDRVKKQLAERDLAPEDWGGKTVTVPVSAVTGEGVEDLLDMILLEAELLELKANPRKPASGIVVEAHLSRGRGAVATLIVQSGTLRPNDIVVAGPYYGRVKVMSDDRGRTLREAGPSTPVEILGLPGVPEAGEKFYVVEDEKQAREITFARREQMRKERLRTSYKITLEDVYARIQAGTIKELNVILKADVQGSLEALKDSLGKIPNEEVRLSFIHTGVGDVNASDVILAKASNAIIIAFQVGMGPRAKAELEKDPVDVRFYRVIYDAVNDVRKALEGLLEPYKRRKFLSRTEVRKVFKLSKAGIVAGCFVIKGKVTRRAEVEVIRNGEVIHTSVISGLKRFKDDVREVAEGYDCGVTVEGFTDFREGDILETFELEEIARTL